MSTACLHGTVPDSARFALWCSALLGGHTSPDEARDAIVADDAAHDVVGLPGCPEPVPLILALGLLGSVTPAGATAAGLALPVPGDPLGLAGPSAFNAEVLDAGEGVLLEQADLGLVPRRAGAGVVWTCLPAVTHRQVPDPSEAGTTLRHALLEAAAVLADLDVARWSPDTADELLDVRTGRVLPLPDSMAPHVVHLIQLATRCRRIVQVALADDGGSLTAPAAQARRAALVPLDHAARRALVAACSCPWSR
ncbi:MAG: hypothetical protein ACRDPB_00830 [Nocardioidaceae bacterium]